LNSSSFGGYGIYKKIHNRFLVFLDTSSWQKQCLVFMATTFNVTLWSHVSPSITFDMELET